MTNAPTDGTSLRIPELLAPAGTLDAFKAALAAGADAIYCGLGSFNARRNAENLTLETFGQACEMAHVAGSRVYVTTNILISQDELPRAMRLVHDAYEAGADAFIVQDWGLLRLLHEYWPQVELHLSTQANVADPTGVELARDLGCSRVTLARELTLDEIAACCGLGVDIEVFGHGALCVCYSGTCLLSSMQRGRSANRGLCRQPCRLPYEILDEHGRDVTGVGGTRLLSPKDCRTIEDLPALMRAGVGSLKVEGRMKAPDYVATVVGAYRRALDALAAGSQVTELDEGVDRALRRAFNRDFTDAYLHGRSDNAMMSFERGNNRGQYAGEVVAARNREVDMELVEPVDKGDLLEIRNPERFDDYVTVAASRDCERGDVLTMVLPRRMSRGCAVRVIRSEAGMAQAREFVARTWPRQRGIDVRVDARLGRPLLVEVATSEDDAHPELRGAVARAVAEGPVLEPARSRALTADDLREHVGRMGTSPFYPRSWSIELDEGVGVGFSTVHAVRAQALDLLRENLLDEHAKGRAVSDVPDSLPEPHRAPTSESPRLCALVTSPAQARAALAAGADDIYAHVDDIVMGPGSSGRRDLAEESGKPDQKNRPDRTDAPSDTCWPDGIVALVGEVGRRLDLDAALPLLGEGARVAVGTVAALAIASRSGACCELWQDMELHNTAAFETVRELGAACVWLSPELSLLEISRLARGAGTCLGITVLGRQRTMTTEHCLLQSLGPCPHQCATCRRRSQQLTLRDEFGRTQLVTSDVHARSRVWETTPLDITPQMPELLRSHVTRFMVDARLMDVTECARAVSHARSALDASIAGRTPGPRLADHSSGHLFSRIG